MQSLEAALIEDAVQRGKRRAYIQIPTAAGRESADRLEYWRTLGAEQGRRIGVETTTYVRNIYKYYVGYKLALAAQVAAGKARGQAGSK